MKLELRLYCKYNYVGFFCVVPICIATRNGHLYILVVDKSKRTKFPYILFEYMPVFFIFKDTNTGKHTLQYITTEAI